MGMNATKTNDNAASGFNTAATPRRPDFEAHDIVFEVDKAYPLNNNQIRFVLGRVFHLPSEDNTVDVIKELPEGRTVGFYTFMPLDEIGKTVEFKKMEFYKPDSQYNPIVGVDPRNACTVPMTSQYGARTLSNTRHNNPCNACKCDKLKPQY